MKLGYIFCCLAHGASSDASGDVDLCGARPSSRASESPAPAPHALATGDALLHAKQTACVMGQPSDAVETAGAQPRRGGMQEPCSAVSGVGQPPGGPISSDLASPPEERLTKKKGQPLLRAAPQSSDHLSVARQCVMDLVMDLRFRPGEELPLGSFCGPFAAAADTAAASPEGENAPSTATGPATGPSTFRRGGASSDDAAAAAAAGGTAASRSPAGAAAYQAFPPRPRRGSTGQGGAAVAVPPRRPSASECTSATGDAAIAAAVTAAAAADGGGGGGVGGGGLGGGAKVRSVVSAGSGRHRHRLLDSSRASAAATWMLQPSLRGPIGGGCGSPPAGSAAHGTAPALAPSPTAAGAGAGAGGRAASFGSSVSLSYPLVVQPAAAGAAPPAGPAAAGAAAEAGAEAVTWAMLRGSSRGSSSSPLGGRTPPVAASPVVCGAPSLIAMTHISAATQIRSGGGGGGGDVGRGLSFRGARGAASPPPPPSAISPGFGAGEDAVGYRSAQRRRLSGTGRAAAADASPAAVPATAAAVTAAVAGAAAGSTTACDDSLGSTVSVSFAGLGAAYWVDGCGAGPGYGICPADIAPADVVLACATPHIIRKAPPPPPPAVAPRVPATRDIAAASVRFTPAASRGGGGAAGGGAAAATGGDTDTGDTEAAVSLSGALRRSASVPAIIIGRPEELVGTLDSCATATANRADGVGVRAGVGGIAAAAAAAAAAQGLFAASRPVPFLLRGSSPRRYPQYPQQQQQRAPAEWRTPLVVLPAARRCSHSQANSSGGGGGVAAAAAAAAAANGGAWRLYRRSQNLSGGRKGGGGKYHSVAVRCSSAMLHGGSGGGGGGAVSGVWVSGGAVAAAPGDGSGPFKGNGSAGSGGGKGLQSAAASAAGGAAAAPPPDSVPYGKVYWPIEALAEAHGLAAAPTGPRHLPYASRHMSQMALLPFLQQQSNSTLLHLAASAPASFNLAALSREITGLRWIGQGGGGVVFQGVWQGVLVAVKFLLTEANGRVDAAALEGVVSTVVNHPNVLHTYAFECSRLTEASFNDSDLHQQGSIEEGGTELLESLMESYTTISDSLNANRRTRYLQGLVAGGHGGGGGGAAAPPLGGGGVASGCGSGGGGTAAAACTTQRLSRLGIPSLTDIPPLTSSSPSAVVAAVAGGGRGSGDWASAGVPPPPAAAAAAVEGSCGDGAAAAAAVSTGRCQDVPGCIRSVPLGSPLAAGAASGVVGGGGGGGGGGGVLPRALRSWFADFLGPTGPVHVSQPPLNSPPRSPMATHRGRSPLSMPRSAAADASSAADAADVDVIIATADGGGGVTCGGGGGAAAAGPRASAPRTLSGHGGGGGGASAGWGGHTNTNIKMTSTFQSEDGFGDPEACLGSQCWTVRQVLSYLKARPGMYMTHIIMEHCDRGSLLSAIKRGIFRIDSTWPEEDGGGGGGGSTGGSTFSRAAAAGGILGCGGGSGMGTGGGGGGGAMWTSSATLGRALTPPCTPPGALATADVSPTSVSASRRVLLRALLRTARDVAQGMCHLHANGIIHGDLKPGNVLLRGCRSDRRGFVAVVSDFGLSKVTRGEKPLDLNHWSTVTVMAPEVIMGTWLKASDVFSFGILLWQLVTGEIMPYGNCTVPQILVGVSQGTLKPEWPSSAHPALVRLGRACLATSPEKRPRFEAIVKVLTKIEKDVRGQLQQLQTPAAAAAAAAGARKTPAQSHPQPQSPAAAVAVAATATALSAAQRARGTIAAATASRPGNGVGGGGAAVATAGAGVGVGPVAARFAAAAAAAAAAAGGGSDPRDPRVAITDWSCTGSSVTFKRALGSTGGSGFSCGGGTSSTGGGGGGGGVDWGRAGGPLSSLGTDGAAAPMSMIMSGEIEGEGGGGSGSVPHTARKLRFL